MNRKGYNEEMIDHLNNNGCYKKLKKNPLNKITKEVCNLIKATNIRGKKPDRNQSMYS